MDDTRREAVMHVRLQGGAGTKATLQAPGSHVEISFDLDRVEMTDEQRAIVGKLFAQNPTALVATDEHTHAAESGRDGPARKYLSASEFESIRKLGVRLGSHGALAAAQCDFCLHCVKLEALPGMDPG